MIKVAVLLWQVVWSYNTRLQIRRYGSALNQLNTESWKGTFSSCKNESCAVLNTPSIPLDLQGTYYRNGGAKFEVGNDRILHPLDADGMITAFTIYNGSVLFRNKFVRTNEYVKELREKRFSYRLVFQCQY